MSQFKVLHGSLWGLGDNSLAGGGGGGAETGQQTAAVTSEHQSAVRVDSGDPLEVERKSWIEDIFWR